MRRKARWGGEFGDTARKMHYYEIPHSSIDDINVEVEYLFKRFGAGRRRSQTAGAGPVWRPSHPDVGKIMCWAVPVKSGAGGNDDICAVALGGHVETRPQAVGVAFQSLLWPAVG